MSPVQPWCCLPLRHHVCSSQTLLFLKHLSPYWPRRSQLQEELPQPGWELLHCVLRVDWKVLWVPTSQCCSGNRETPGSGQDKQVEQLLKLQRHLADPSHWVYITTLWVFACRGSCGLSWCLRCFWHARNNGFPVYLCLLTNIWEISDLLTYWSPVNKLFVLIVFMVCAYWKCFVCLFVFVFQMKINVSVQFFLINKDLLINSNKKTTATSTSSSSRRSSSLFINYINHRQYIDNKTFLTCKHKLKITKIITKIKKEINWWPQTKRKICITNTVVLVLV